jgi:hypothetical protein
MICPFGTGVLYGVQVAGGAVTPNPTPFRFGVLQDTQVDIKGENKKLYGQKMSPVRIRRGKIDITVKSKLAALDPNMLNQLFFACPSVAGITLVADSEPQIVGAAAPAARANSTAYTVGQLYSSGGFVYKCVTAGESAAALPALETVIGSENADGTAVFQCLCAVTNSISVVNVATFATDYGVSRADGTPMLNSGAVAPLVGQYQVSGGAYVFNAADAAAAVLISYTYTNPQRGTTITLANQFQGYAPEFKALLYNMDSNGRYFALDLNDCVASDIGIPSKQGDFWISSFDFEAMADATDVWGHIYSDNA